MFPVLDNEDRTMILPLANNNEPAELASFEKKEKKSSGTYVSLHECLTLLLKKVEEVVDTVEGATMKKNV